MSSTVDHLVVAARTLDEGRRYVSAALGVALEPGGKHESMGTHNCLVRLSNASYLEVIAVDPDALPPSVPRWFALDDPRMQQRLERRPALVTWVVRAANVLACARAAPGVGQVRSMRRGAFAWQLTVRDDGTLPFGGVVPSFIEWHGGTRPAASLADRDLRLVRLAGTHPNVAEVSAMLRALRCDRLIELSDGEPSLTATIATSRGIVEFS